MDGQERKRRLLKMKRYATALLAAMACLFVVSHVCGRTGIWEWIGAFAEAATIGALADWFAVAALFRHPLSIPIPHTAIIARNKDRIADNLAVFIRDKFLSREAMTARLKTYEPARRMAVWLCRREKADFLAGKTLGALSGALAFVDDARIGGLLRSVFCQQIDELDMGSLASHLAETLTREGQHQRLLDVLLARFSSILDEPGTHTQLASAIIEVSRREYPTLLKMLGLVMDTDEFGMRVAKTLLSSLQGWLRDIGDDPAHFRRQQFDELVKRFSVRLKTDPEYHACLEDWKRQLLEMPAVSGYFGTLWRHWRRQIEEDAARTDSVLERRLSGFYRNTGRWILKNPAVAESIEEQMVRLVHAVSEDIRETAAQHITGTVRNWDTRSMVDGLELAIGKDLQFIRINGTLVGGSIGVVLHAVIRLFPA